MSSSVTTPSSRPALAPIGSPIAPLLTFDIFDALRAHNRFVRYPDPPTIFDFTDGSSGDSASERSTEGHTSDENLGDRDVRRERRGPNMRIAKRTPALQRWVEGRQARERFQAAFKSFPRDATPQEPWTEAELSRADTYIPEDRPYSKNELVGPGADFPFDIVQWQGREILPIVDRTQWVFALAGGTIEEPDGPTVIRDATMALGVAALLAGEPASGGFMSITGGLVSLDEQIARAARYASNDRERRALDYLQSHVAVGRLAEFGNHLFAAFAPKAFAVACARTAALFDVEGTRTRIFLGAWTTWTFDLGPQTVTRPLVATDRSGWCWIAITVLGDFDPDLGGHLILWDLGRLLRFPPGTTVLLPPVLRYSIARIQPGETRYSLTQSCAAPPGWARWPSPVHLFTKLQALRT